jgi:hypothetical protein
MAVLCGARTSRASIAPEESHLHGQVDIEWPSRRSLSDELAVILSGPIAEMIYRSEPMHPGLVAEWSQDWMQAWSLARPHAATDTRCLEMLEQIVARLHRTLSQDQYWAAISAVQDLLLAHEEIGHEVIVYEVNAWLR